jgi:hypothetical protein
LLRPVAVSPLGTPALTTHSFARELDATMQHLASGPGCGFNEHLVATHE